VVNLGLGIGLGLWLVLGSGLVSWAVNFSTSASYPERIQRFLLILLKFKHNRWLLLTTYVTVCVCHAELKGYLLA